MMGCGITLMYPFSFRPPDTTIKEPQTMSHRPTLKATTNILSLLDYRRQVSDLYAWLRQSNLPPDERCIEFRRRKDILFGTHPQSALTTEQQKNFKGLSYYPYDPAWCFELSIDTGVEPDTFDIALQADGLTRIQRFGKVRFILNEQDITLSLFWILGYGGGVFLSFKDQTSGQTTYGGGRYLLDTIKHADLGQIEDRLVIDFNYAYNPSCAYNHQWHCPLPLPENWLSTKIPVGEKILTS